MIVRTSFTDLPGVYPQTDPTDLALCALLFLGGSTSMRSGQSQSHRALCARSRERMGNTEYSGSENEN